MIVSFGIGQNNTLKEGLSALDDKVKLKIVRKEVICQLKFVYQEAVRKNARFIKLLLPKAAPAAMAVSLKRWVIIIRCCPKIKPMLWLSKKSWPKKWMGNGAELTERVQKLFALRGLVEAPKIKEQPKKSAPKAKAQERMKEEAEKKAAAEEAKRQAEEAAKAEAEAAKAAAEAPAEETPAE